MTEVEKLYLQFADRFEKEFITQGSHEDRDIEKTLDVGWELLSALPETEFSRIDPAIIETYHPKYRSKDVKE